MMMTWKPTHVPDEDAFKFAAIRAGIDALPPGVKMLLNSGEFYGQGFTVANLELVARFFEKYPEYADRTFLSVKGRLVPGEMKVLNETVKEGKFNHIGLSEVRAETIAAKLAAVEIEVSLQAYEQQTKDGEETLKEISGASMAVSRMIFVFYACSRPFAQAADTRLSQTKSIGHNLELVEGLTYITNRKGITVAQLSIAWVGALGSHIIPLPGSSNVKRTLKKLGAGDMELSTEDLTALGEV
ncbi:aldo/keto reductase [Russula emetica]|nr:aldo/keto reductase [Russula emetica]